MPARHQWRAISDAFGHRIRLGFNLIIEHDAIHQFFVQRFCRIKHPAFEQNFERHRATHQRQQSRQLAITHGQAQFVDRHAKAAGLATNAHVAARGNFQPAANTGALDHCHGRVFALRHRLHGGIDQFAVGLGLLRVGAFSSEFSNIRTCRKRFFTHTTQHHTAQ